VLRLLRRTRANRIPLALTVTAANRNDITQLLEIVDRIAPVGPHGKFRPKVLLADRAYDSRRHRAECDRGITPKTASATPPNGSGLAHSAGSSSARSPGCTTTAASHAAMTAAPTSTQPS
jgi:hypothetical protein